MKWLSRLKLSKSFHEPIQQDERKKRVDSLAFCLLSSLTRRGGKRKKGKCAGRGGGWIEDWCMDTDGLKRGHFVDLILCFSIISTSPRTCFSPLQNANLFCRHTYKKIHIQSNHLEPPERGDNRVSPSGLNTHTHTVQPSYFARVSNKTKGAFKEKRQEEKERGKRVSISLQSSTWATFIDQKRESSKAQAVFPLPPLPPAPLSLQGPLSMKRAI